MTPDQIHQEISPVVEGTSDRSISWQAESFGVLQRELAWTLGETRAHGVLGRTGFSMAMRDMISPAEEPKSALYTIAQGIRESKEQDPVLELDSSMEATGWVYFHSSRQMATRCWLMAGYLTGFYSHKKGRPIYFLETQCQVRKDALCKFVGRPWESWDGEKQGQLTAYREDNVALELEQSLEQLKLTRDRYQNLFEQSSVPICIAAPTTGAFIDANHATEELTGYTRAELLKMTIFEVRHPREHPRLAATLRNLKDGPPTEEEVTIVHKDGTNKTVAVARKVITYGGKKMIQAVLRDITALKVSELKQKDLQHQLLRTERLSTLGQLAAGVAHEIKNPLGAIKNAIYFLRGTLKNQPKSDLESQLSEVMRVAEDEVDGAVKIIEELLDFSKVVHLLPRQTNINQLLQELPSNLKVPENVQLVWDLDATLPSPLIDPNRMTQAFSNIFNNAIQAMPTGGKIKIKTRHEFETADEGKSAELITVTFEDSGVGIEPSNLKKIFEPLFTTKARGTGLGLAITNNIVEKHGGVLVVASQPGKGSSFTIKLPLQISSEDSYANEQNIVG